MMDELPAIIHRLSLRLWCPDQIPREEWDAVEENGEPGLDPFASPPHDAVDANGNLLDPSEIESLTLDGGPELQTLFSQKNLLRLATLGDCNRTMSLFTPGIRDVVFRAWAGSQERPEVMSTPLLTPNLTGHNMSHGNSTTYTFSDTSSMTNGSLPTRPSLASLNSATTGLSLGAGRSRSHAGRKKKTRVVNLRKKTSESAPASDASDTATETDSTMDGPMSAPLITTTILEEPEEYFQAPLTPSKVRFKDTARTDVPIRPTLDPALYSAGPSRSKAEQAQQTEQVESRLYTQGETEKSTDSKGQVQFEPRRGPGSDTSSVILEQAWISKMAGEIARRVYEEKKRNPGFWDEREDAPPPAYEAS